MNLDPSDIHFATIKTKWLQMGRSCGQIATTVRHHGTIDDIHGVAWLNGRVVRWTPQRLMELRREYRGIRNGR